MLCSNLVARFPRMHSALVRCRKSVDSGHEETSARSMLPPRCPTQVLSLLIVVVMASPMWAAGDEIQFDLPPTVAAKPIADEQHDANMVECRFQISALVTAPQTPQIDQWIVICQPRDGSPLIADYYPKTDVASDLEGPIQVKTTREESGSIGLSLDGQYGHAVRGNLGADKGHKHSDSRQYALTAPAARSLPRVRSIAAAAFTSSGNIQPIRSWKAKKSFDWSCVCLLTGAEA